MMGHINTCGNTQPIILILMCLLWCMAYNSTVKSPLLNNTNEETMNKLSNPPPGWNIEADEAVERFLVQHDNFTTIAEVMCNTPETLYLVSKYCVVMI